MWLIYPLSLPTLAAPVHAWGQKLLHGVQCCQFIFAHGCCWMSWVLNKPLLVLHFVCIWTGWDWDGGGRFRVVFVWLCLLLFLFFFNLKQRSWDLLKGFPTSCFSVWHNLPIYPLPIPQRKQEAFPVCLWSNQLPEPKDHGEHPVFAFKTKWYWGTLIPLFFCLCGLQKQATHF